MLDSHCTILGGSLRGKSISCETRLFQGQAGNFRRRSRRITIDGESDWLDDAMLIAVYVMLGVGFFMRLEPATALLGRFHLVQLGDDRLAIGLDLVLATVAADVECSALGCDLDRLAHRPQSAGCSPGKRPARSRRPDRLGGSSLMPGQFLRASFTVEPAGLAVSVLPGPSIFGASFPLGAGAAVGAARCLHLTITRLCGRFVDLLAHHRAGLPGRTLPRARLAPPSVTRLRRRHIPPGHPASQSHRMISS